MDITRATLGTTTKRAPSVRRGAPWERPSGRIATAAKRVDVVLASGDEPGARQRARAPAGRDLGDPRGLADPRPVPREQRPLDSNGSVLGAVLAIVERDGDGQQIADRDARRSVDLCDDAGQPIRAREQERREEERRATEDEHVRLGAHDVPGEEHGEAGGTEEDATFPREPGEEPREGSQAAGEPAVAIAIALRFGRRNEHMVESSEIGFQTGTRRLDRTSINTPSGPRPPYRASGVSVMRWASTGAARA